MKRYADAISMELRQCFRLSQICTHGVSAITAEELAVRVAIERRHEAGVQIASREQIAEELVREHAGRCPCCGELIGEVDRCPVCKTQQRSSGQRNSAQRKTIGGFCGRRK